MSTRGEHLVRADRRFATGGGLVARLTAPAIDRVLDQIDRRLERGGLEVVRPDGTRRRLGFHASGPNATVHLSSWMALVRLATSGSVGWYKAWTLGEWSSPDPVALFELFSANAVSLGDVGRAKGPFRWINALAHRLRDNAPRTARRNIAAH
jgi:cyclopropane-fatty-acyl-phospholipid synthase